jgi:hypothetical protein
MRLTLPKWGLESPLGFLKFQSSMAGVKTPRIEAFFISLEKYQSVDVKNGLAWAIWTSASFVMAKRKAKSRESTRPKCVQVECDTPLESSRWELQPCFRPRPNRRTKQKIIVPQSCKSPNRDNFGIPFWESRDKKSFGCRCHGKTKKILYGGRW